MSWGRNSIRARAIAAAILLFGASAAAADILIIRSVGPSAKAYPPGKKLPGNGKVTLKASDQLVLLDERGTRTLKGPGSFALNSAPQRIGAVGAESRLARARIGGTREDPPPSIWDVDVAGSTTFCVADPNSLSLRRDGTRDLTTLTITRTKDRKNRKIEWEAGEATLKWPSQLPVTENAEFRLERQGIAGSTNLRFRLLPKKPYAPQDVASALIANGCTAQLDLFIEKQQEAANAPGS